MSIYTRLYPLSWINLVYMNCNYESNKETIHEWKMYMKDNVMSVDSRDSEFNILNGLRGTIQYPSGPAYSFRRYDLNKVITQES